MKSCMSIRARSWALHSLLDVPTFYTRETLKRFWKSKRFAFFFDWGSGNVYMGRPPQNPDRVYEQVKTFHELLERSRRNPAQKIRGK